MKLSTLVPLGVIVALSAPACSHNAVGYQAAGYSPRDAYYRGHTDGSADRYTGKPYNPHINTDRTLPGSHRNDYLWGYGDGFKNPGGYGGSK